MLRYGRSPLTNSIHVRNYLPLCTEPRWQKATLITGDVSFSTTSTPLFFSRAHPSAGLVAVVALALVPRARARTARIPSCASTVEGMVPLGPSVAMLIAGLLALYLAFWLMIPFAYGYEHLTVPRSTRVHCAPLVPLGSLLLCVPHMSPTASLASHSRTMCWARSFYFMRPSLYLPCTLCSQLCMEFCLGDCRRRGRPRVCEWRSHPDQHHPLDGRTACHPRPRGGGPRVATPFSNAVWTGVATFLFSVVGLATSARPSSA